MFVCALCNLFLSSIGYGPTHVCCMSIRLHFGKLLEVVAEGADFELVGAFLELLKLLD